MDMILYWQTKKYSATMEPVNPVAPNGPDGGSGAAAP